MQTLLSLLWVVAEQIYPDERADFLITLSVTDGDFCIEVLDRSYHSCVRIQQLLLATKTQSEILN
jgi:hypothetical protein